MKKILYISLMCLSFKIINGNDSYWHAILKNGIIRIAYSQLVNFGMPKFKRNYLILITTDCKNARKFQLLQSFHFRCFTF